MALEMTILKRIGKKLSLKGLWINLIIVSLFFSMLAYTEVRFRGLVSGINRVQEDYTVDMVSLSETTIQDVLTFKDQSVGILTDENSDAGYIAPHTFSDENKLNLVFKPYPSYLDMVRGLINGDVKYIVLPSGYQTTFSSIDELSTELELLHTVYSFDSTRNIVVENKSSDVLNLVLIGGDNPILGNSTSGFNYDVIVVISMNFKTHESSILSIPRDSYIYLTCTERKDKITHSGWYGADCLTDSLSRFLGIEIHNYMLVDFKGLISLVDSMGGVWIDVETTIDEQDENRNFDNMIHIDPGYQLLNGQESLAFLRHRHTLATGAIGRSENHEKFILAVIQQLASPTSILKMGSIFGALERSVLTNLSNDDMYTYYQKAVDSVSSGGIEAVTPKQLSLSGHGELIYTPSFGLNLYYYVLDNNSIQVVKSEFGNIQVSQ